MSFAVAMAKSMALTVIYMRDVGGLDQCVCDGNYEK